MRVKYSTNWMGPLNREWIEKNGRQWAGGRIDVHGDVPEYTELGIRIMRGEDWRRFTYWLNDFVTPEIWTTEQLVMAYELYNTKIVLWEDNGDELQNL